MLKNRCQSFSWLTRDSLATHQSWNSQVTSSSKSFQDLQKFLRLNSWFTSRKTPRNNFLKGFSWETCFKPLPSFLKPLIQYFYIKTQPIWMVFHSINISKVILNSFHWFGFLDYVLESFVLLVGILIIGVGKTKFLYGIGWFWWFALDVGHLWQKEHVLRVDFMIFMHCFTLLFIVCTLCVW